MSDSDDSDSKQKAIIINQYQRRKIIKAFSDDGGGPVVCKSLIKKGSKLSLEMIGDFLHKKAQAAQAHVEEEVATEEFLALEKWINYFKENELNSKCGSELSLLLKTIAVAEPHPKCDENDINFSKLYAWLADVMQGNVPLELNAQSQIFLVQQFQDILAAANASGNEKEFLELKRAITQKTELDDFDSASMPDNDFINSVDPLELNLKKKLKK